MKKESLWHRLRMMLRVALHYTRQHAQSLDAIKGIYTKQCLPLEIDFSYSIVLKIRPQGSLYQVTRSRFLDDDLVREEIWLATYGWHSNGHLIEIGGHRYCIFDPLQKTLYLEDYTTDVKTVEVFVQN